MNTDFVITSGLYPDLRVWIGRYGWYKVPADLPGHVGQGHKYRTVEAAARAIKRMTTKYPGDECWQNAGYCTHDEALSDDNPLGIDWSA